VTIVRKCFDKTLAKRAHAGRRIHATMRRRDLLNHLGRTAALLALGSLFTPGQGRSRIEPLPGADDPFTLGVASGMPGPDSVLLWTRLAPDPLNGGGMPDANVPVRWEIAADAKFSKIIEFDGLWEDMNEASNFCRGKCFKDDLTPFDSIANRLPYTPTGKRLDRISLPLDAKMNDSRSQLDAHSFYGTLQSRASSLYY
jgi:hypothetical protein